MTTATSTDLPSPVFRFEVKRKEYTEAVSMAMGVNREGLKLSDIVKDFFKIEMTTMSSLYDRIVYSLVSEHTAQSIEANPDGSFDILPIKYRLVLKSTPSQIEGSVSYCEEYLHDLDIPSIERMLSELAKYVESTIANVNPLKTISQSINGTDGYPDDSYVGDIASPSNISNVYILN